MADYEWRKGGEVITEQDFGRVLAGASAQAVTVQLANTSANDWVSVSWTLVQGDTDGAYATASIAGQALSTTSYDSGPLAAGATLDVALGWVTPTGTPGHAGDFAGLNFTAQF